MNINGRIEALLQLGVTNAAIARRAGVSTPTIFAIRKGKKDLYLSSYIKVERALDAIENDLRVAVAREETA